jgi:hypothetical protein
MSIENTIITFTSPSLNNLAISTLFQFELILYGSSSKIVTIRYERHLSARPQSSSNNQPEAAFIIVIVADLHDFTGVFFIFTTAASSPAGLDPNAIRD